MTIAQCRVDPPAHSAFPLQPALLLQALIWAVLPPGTR
jgi:hypothetical protein